MKKPETKFKEKVIARLKEIPHLWYAKIQSVSIRGIPDLLICYKGNFVAWELKTDIGTPEALQEYTLNNIRKAGGAARIVTPSNVAEAFMEDLWVEY